MKFRILVLLTFACLATGIGLIFVYCNGTTGFDAAWPISGTALHLNITTTGIPAIAGFLLTLIGLLLTIVTVISTFVGIIATMIPHRKHKETVGTKAAS